MPEHIYADMALELGATRAAYINVGDIRFSKELRGMCASNACGRYGSNWRCPPHVGAFEQCADNVRAFERGVLFQTVTALEDSYDVEGWERGGRVHAGILLELVQRMRGSCSAIYPMGAGGCSRCSECTVHTGEPCRCPELSFPSVEAHGIHVAQILNTVDMPYINGPNTVSYVGIVLFKT